MIMEDVIDFIENGGEVINPQNPKGKKKKLPQYLHTDDIDDVYTNDDLVDDILRQPNKNIYDLNEYNDDDYESYKDYGVTVNRINTKKELDNLRGRNQNAMEQIGHFAMQAGVGEVGVGMFLGLSNLIDMGINLFKEKGEDDYTNSMSTFLEDIKEDINKKYTIYQENAGESFQFGDFGWWASNGVSVASTASLLIPSTGIIKGVSLLGKLGKAGKLGKLGKVAMSARTAGRLAIAGKKLGMVDNVFGATKFIKSAMEVGASAVLSRTMENYQEGREVYKEVQQETLDKINRMNNKEYDDFIKRNPELKGKSKEEQANYMASVSADETFANDYWMLAMDIAQLGALRKLFKGIPKKEMTAKLKILNKEAGLNLNNTTGKALRLSKYDRFKISAEYNLKNYGAQLSEGFEEGFQGIQTEKGKEVAKRMMDVDYENRSLTDYLQDSVIWEQAFWGIAGGITFQGVGQSLGSVGNKVKDVYNKKHMSEEEYEINKLTDEKLRETEITGRKAIMDAYVDNMNTINEGFNPFSKKTDEQGKPVIVEGVEQLEDLNEAEKDLLKKHTTAKFATDMVLDATDRGNYSLFKEFIKNDEFGKYVEKNISKEDKQFSTQLIEMMDEVHNQYSSDIYTLFTSINDIKHENIALATARKMTRNKMNINSLNKSIEEDNIKIDELNDKGYDIESVADKERLNLINHKLDKLKKDTKEIEDLYNKKEISKQAYEEYQKDINSYKKDLYNSLVKHKEFYMFEGVSEIYDNINGIDESKLKDLENKYNEYVKSSSTDVTQNDKTPTKDITNIIKDRVVKEQTVESMEYNTPDSQEKLEDYYREVEDAMLQNTHKRLIKAVDKVTDWLEQQDDLDISMKNIMDNKVVELEEELQILKIGYSNTENYTNQIAIMLNAIKQDRLSKKDDTKIEKQQKEDVEEIVNEAIDENKVEDETNKTNDVVDVERESEIDENTPSTGREVQSDDVIADMFGEPEDVNSEVDDETINKTKDDNKSNSIENSTKTNPNEAIPDFISDTMDTLDKEQEKQVVNHSKTLEMSIDERAGSIASSLVFELYRESNNLFDALKGKDETSAEFNKIVDIISEKLFVQGISAGITRQASITGLKLSLPIIGRRTKVAEFVSLAQTLAVKHSTQAQNNSDKFAITRLVSEEDFNETVDAFIEQYIDKRNIITSENNKTQIDVEDLFHELLNSKELSIEQVKYIFRNITHYILSPNSKYIFKNNKIVKDNINNSDQFIETLLENRKQKENIDDYMHVPLPSYNKTQARDVIGTMRSGQDISIERTGNSISFKVKGIEVGYIGTVKMTTDGAGFSLSNQWSGFVRTVSKTANGSYVDNFDDLFLGVIDKNEENSLDKVYDLVYQQYLWEIDSYNNKSISKENINDVLNNPIIKDYIDKGLIKFGKNHVTDLQKTKFILNRIGNVVFYNTNVLSTNKLKDSYFKWKKSTYNNYKNTYTLQNKLNNGKTINVKYKGANEGKAIKTNDTRDINSIGLTYDGNPIIAVTDKNTIIVEGKKEPYNNTIKSKVGNMGMLIRDNKNSPIIAMFYESNKVSTNKELTTDIKQEVSNILKNFFDKTITFEELSEKLGYLFGGANTNVNSIFKGYNIVKSEDSVAISVNGEKGKYLTVIYKNKKGSEERGTGMVYFPNGDRTVSKTIISYNKNTINDIVKEILDNLEFNKSFFTINNTEYNSSDNNKYFYKEKGKFIININGNKKIYENYGHFVLANNAFKTNQGINENGGFFEENKDINSLYINPFEVVSPVERMSESKSITTNKSIKSVLEGSNKYNPASSKEVLESAGVSNDIIKIITGNNSAELSLIEENIYYDKTTTKANGVYKNGKVYITKGGIKLISKNPREAIRILLHESFHKRLEESGVFKRANIVNNLYDTYEQFVNALNEDVNKLDKKSKEYKQVKLILDTFVNKNFTLENYGNSLNVKSKKDWNNKTIEEKKRIFAEEWLVESLTQPAIVKYLNSTKYKGDVIDVENIDNSDKTIWQKIIDVLLKLFNVNTGNIKNNSILAKEYEILGNVKLEENDNIEVDNKKGGGVDNQNNQKKDIVENDIVDENEDLTEDNIEEEFDEFDEDLYTITNMIESIENNSNNNNKKISNMRRYVSRFPNKEREYINNMIEKGELSFICK